MDDREEASTAPDYDAGFEDEPVRSFTREELIKSYYDYQRTNDEALFWAWEAADELRQGHLDESWATMLEFISAAPDPASLGLLAAGALEDLLDDRGDELIDRIEIEAPVNPRLREALASVWIGPDDVEQSVVDRLEACAEKYAVDWPLGSTGMPKLVEDLLVSDRIEDRRWGVRQLISIPYMPVVRDRLRQYLRSGDEAMRETAAQALAFEKEVELLPELIDELNQHAGVDGARNLTWAVYWLAHIAEPSMAAEARAALSAIADRGDEQTREHVTELLDPDAPAKARRQALADIAQFDAWIEQSLSDLQAQGWPADEFDPDLRKQQSKLRALAKRLENDQS